ncbi:MAG: DNA-binding protein [Rhodobacterales bacterium]|nr:MAG: DNA-binding protein [Rhodobacterales bacterium]
MVVNEIEAVLAGPVLRKKALIDEVTQRAGIKRRDAKPAVDAVLAILGEALVEGRELNLPPMGKIKIRKTKKVSNGTIMQARIRQPEKGRNAGKDPLAEAAE